MNEPNNKHFENEWEMAFENQEIKPSDSVWKEVEFNLAKSENSSNKKRILFFQLLAAASVSFAMVVGSVQLYNVNYNDELTEHESNPIVSDNETKDQMSTNETQNDLKDASNSINLNESKPTDLIVNESNSFISKKNDQIEISNSDKLNDQIDANNSNDKNASIFSGVTADNKNINSQDDVELNSVNSISTNNSSYKSSLSNSIADGNKEDNELSNLNGSEVVLNGNDQFFIDEKDYLVGLGYELDFNKPEQIEMHMVPWLVYATNSKRSNNFNKSTWTGINMSAGTFNPNSSNSGDFAMAMDRGIALDDVSSDNFSNSNPLSIGTEQSGSSYGLGLNLGTQISKKVVVLGGLNYLQQTTSSSSNVVTTGGENFVVSSYNELNSSSQYQKTNRYEIRNTYETISIPVQAGVYLVDRKFNVLVLGGIANDFFIKKNLKDTSGKSSGESKSFIDNGYSLYTIGGLIGTQFSYDLGEQYSIAVQPQIKQMLNSFTPDGNTHTTFEVGFRFNYKLK